MQALSIKEMCLHYHINVDSNYIQNYLIFILKYFIINSLYILVCMLIDKVKNINNFAYGDLTLFLNHKI